VSSDLAQEPASRDFSPPGMAVKPEETERRQQNETYGECSLA